MLDITSLTSLVDALRAETAKDSISPESLGSILQKILDLLATAAPSSDVAALQSWKVAVTSIGTVLSGLDLGSDDRNNVTLTVAKTNPVTALSMLTNLTIRQATTERAGVMRAQQVTDLNTAKKQAAEAANSCITFSKNLSTAISERNGMFNQLNAKITSEANTRQTADDNLTTAIKDETNGREKADTALQKQIDAIKTNASSKPFYHRQCDSSNDILTMRGASFLVSQGYTPLLFRYTVRQGRNGHKVNEEGRRCYQRVHRGWHLCHASGKLHISGNKIEFYDEQAKKFTTSPAALFGQMTEIYDRNNKVVEVRVGYGKRTYNVIGHHRFRFAIAFAKKPVFNEAFDFNTLVTNLAEFRVYVTAPRGAKQAYFAFSI